jgi:hypothetical protein
MVIPTKHPNLPNHHLEGAERLKVDHVDQETKVDQEDQMDQVKLVEANAGQWVLNVFVAVRDLVVLEVLMGIAKVLKAVQVHVVILDLADRQVEVVVDHLYGLILHRLLILFLEITNNVQQLLPQ